MAITPIWSAALELKELYDVFGGRFESSCSTPAMASDETISAKIEYKGEWWDAQSEGRMEVYSEARCARLGSSRNRRVQFFAHLRDMTLPHGAVYLDSDDKRGG